MTNKIHKTTKHKYNLTVEEAHKILNSSTMKNLKCNFKVYKPTNGTKNKGGKNKPPKYFTDFKQEMLAFKQEMLAFKQEMLAFKQEMLAFKQEMLDFKKQMLDFVQEQRQFNKQQLEFNKLIMSRIDNLVSKNNLKE